MGNIQNILKDCGVSFTTDDTWCYIISKSFMVEQGWKIHISTQLIDYEKILSIVLPFLIDNNCNFKICKDLDTLKKINSPREISPTANKFITIYNENSDKARYNIIALFSMLSNFNSPKILSDFRCGKHSPVHYRYGAFKKYRQYDRKNKKLLYYIKGSDGNLVEDKRTSYPILLEGVAPLFSLEEKTKYFNETPAESENGVTKLNQYNIEKILKKSNRGNVYKGKNKSSLENVIIKQARPFLAYDFEGTEDAITELKNEVAMLTQFNSKEYTGSFFEEFYILDDYFVVQKYIEGKNLLKYFDMYPINTEERIEILNELVFIINDIHAHGFKVVDLSPSNFLYNKKYGLVLIDLENIVSIDKIRRYVHTPYYVNPDTDLTKCNIGQEYFALCMISYLIFTGKPLIFTTSDYDGKINTTDKILNMMQIANDEGKITDKQLSWLKYLLDLSFDNKVVKILKYEEVSESTLKIKKINDLFDYEVEVKKLIKYLLCQKIDKEGRFFESTDFGKFVDPISFQHGLSGLLLLVASRYDVEYKSYIMEKISVIREISNNKNYYHQHSLLFGEAGFLVGILNLYNASNDTDYLLIAKQVIQKILANYDKINELDFALGKAGIILSIMKYYKVTGDNRIEKFIRKNIGEIYQYFLTRNHNSKSVIIDSFAHGFSGIAYVLQVYRDLFKAVEFSDELDKFSCEVRDLLIENTKNNKKIENLELSWCEGLSGLITYLCLSGNFDEDENVVIQKSQEFIVEEYMSMLTGYCHGLSSLLQTIYYSENDMLKYRIFRILASRSHRNKEGLLVFQGDDGKTNLFDFGVGSMGVYWCLLGNKFPFDIT